jgi:hypothetical protein
VFLFDVDNTLIDNDRVQDHLSEHLSGNYGATACESRRAEPSRHHNGECKPWHAMQCTARAGAVPRILLRIQTMSLS